MDGVVSPGLDSRYTDDIPAVTSEANCVIVPLS